MQVNALETTSAPCSNHPTPLSHNANPSHNCNSSNTVSFYREVSLHTDLYTKCHPLYPPCPMHQEHIQKSLGTKKFTGPTMHCNALKCPEMHKKYILYPLEEVPRCRKTISPSAIFRRKLCQSCSKVPKSRGKQRTSFLLPLGLHSHLGKQCNDQRDAI